MSIIFIINLWLECSFAVSKRRSHVLIPFPQKTSKVTKVKFQRVLEGNKGCCADDMENPHTQS